QEPEERPRRVPPIEPAVPLVGQAPVLPAPPTISRARPHAKIWYADEGCPIEPHGVVQRGADEPAARWTAAHRATAASSEAPAPATPGRPPPPAPGGAPYGRRTFPSSWASGVPRR